MPEDVAERFRFALEVLQPAPADRLLEIGCGPGVAVSLVASRLTAGRIVAIDRSPAMIARASRRNRELLARGTAELRAAELADADLGNAQFDKVFAVNVRLFSERPADEADVLRRALAPTGVLSLFHQHPSERRTRAAAAEAADALEATGFAVRDMPEKGRGDSTIICVVAGRRG